jgi:DNA adenine methylase
VQAGGQLPAETVSKDDYYKIRDNKSAYPDWYIGYIGFICSFRSKFFGSYAGVCGKRNY